MRIGLQNRLIRPRRRVTVSDVLQSELKKAYDLHPGYLFPSSIVVALEDAGFTIISEDDLDNEIALAFQAGVDSVVEPT